MTRLKETRLQSSLQRLIKRRGGYVRKNHGNMITVKGLSDLSFTYKGLSLYWEVKTPKDAKNVSPAQGIHCRLAKKAGGITAIISTKEQAEIILDRIDIMYDVHFSIKQIHSDLDRLFKLKELDDGTKY